jgi:type I restriction enzyme S subunit
MKRYKAYKDSGIEWLGEVPEHWKIYRAKNTVSLINERALDPSLKKVALENIESGTGKYIETDSEYEGEGTLFHKNDILFGKLRPYLAKVYKAEFEGQSVGDIYVFRGKEGTNPDFLKYMFISDLFISVVDGSTYGAKMPRANWDFISNLKIAIPNLEEQTIIANYLDDTIGKVDSLIFAKEKQVEDLQQYRSSVISEAVTRGLHPEVEFKETDGDKFNEIPSHWDFSRLKYSGSIKSGDGIKGEDILPNGKYEVFGGNGFMGYTTQFNVIPPAIIVGRVGALCGNVRLINDPKWITDNALILKLSKNDYKYVYYMLIAYDLNSLNTSNAQPLITGTKVLNILIPVPPLSEQKEIADFLDEKTSKIDTTIKELKTQIEDLRQYKKSVISEAVTGKVDLRDWKPK